MVIANSAWREQRVGIGFDLHRLVVGRPCVLGGVVLEAPAGPLGHSDGDVLTHALIDALLGAAGEGDIGTWFPDSDPAYQNASSVELLARIWEHLQGLGWQLGNVDAVLIAEKPKIAPHVAMIRARLAQAMQVEPMRIHLKGKTHEGLEALGRGEAIAAYVVCCIGR